MPDTKKPTTHKVSARAKGIAHFVAARNLATFIDMMPAMPPDVAQAMKQIAIDLGRAAGPYNVPFEEFAGWGMAIAAPDVAGSSDALRQAAQEETIVGKLQ